MAKPYVPYTGPVVTREKAAAQGLPRFFTGKPCKHGHLSQRGTRNGGCIQCNAESIRALYYAETPEQRKLRQAKGKLWKDAHRDQVREAGRIYSRSRQEQSKAWKAVNHEKVLAGSRDYYRRNRDAILAKAAERYAADPMAFQAYYEANAERIKARVNAYRLARPDETRAAKEAWYTANKAVVMERVREWNAANPEATRSRGRNYRARFKGAEGSHTGDDIKDLFIKQQGRCVYCNVKLGTGYHVDHITALSKGGSNWPSNLQLTCADCNNRKRATDPIEFARRNGKLL
jgi:5-methylcytosine-specific restriction endonuclease McrA